MEVMSEKILTADELGSLSRQLLKKGYDESLYCPAPEAHINKGKPAILFVGLNPAGGVDDAKRDQKTSGLLLNYYKEFDRLSSLIDSSCSGKCLVYKSYYEPIFEFFKEVTGDSIAWEWCNYSDFNDVLSIIKKVEPDLSDDDIDIIKQCYDEYRESPYQLIVRDMVYYHQTKGFKKNLVSISSAGVTTVIKRMLDAYIGVISPENLKLVYISSSTACHYFCEALQSESKDLESFGGVYCKYDGYSIPVLFAGRPLNGLGTIDIYSRRRLVTTVKDLLGLE